MMIKTKTIIARVPVANVIPPILAQKILKNIRAVKQTTESINLNSKKEVKTELSKEQLEKLFKEIHLNGIKDWSEEDQEEANN